MNKILTAVTAVMLFSGVSTPVHAAFYFEGLTQYQDAPNCNDPYAKTCGRYGQVEHEKKPSEKVNGMHLEVQPKTEPEKPSVRRETRPGLEK